MIYELKRRFNNLRSIERVVALITSILVFAGFANYYLNNVDITPAEQMYVDEIVERLNKVSSDPNILLKNPGKVTIKKDSITYSIENAQCKATGKYDKEYKLIDYKVDDSASPLGIAILTAFFAGFVLSIFTYFAVAIIMSILCGIYFALFKDYLYE